MVCGIAGKARNHHAECIAREHTAAVGHTHAHSMRPITQRSRCGHGIGGDTGSELGALIENIVEAPPYPGAKMYLLIDERYTPDEAVSAGFDRAYVDRVWRLIRAMHFKRRSPLIAKLSKRTVGIDFNYLRDWGY